MLGLFWVEAGSLNVTSDFLSLDIGADWDLLKNELLKSLVEFVFSPSFFLLESKNS